MKLKWDSIPEARDRVLMKKYVFHINKNCFHLEDALRTPAGALRLASIAKY